MKFLNQKYWVKEHQTWKNIKHESNNKLKHQIESEKRKLLGSRHDGSQKGTESSELIARKGETGNGEDEKKYIFLHNFFVDNFHPKLY